MNIVEQIKQRLKEMTPAEKAAASYALCHFNEIAFFSLEQFAERAYTSTASVLRFCRRLSFDGFRDFQNAVRSEIQYHPDLPDKYRRLPEGEQSSMELPARILSQSMQCLQESFRLLSPQDLSLAVQRISSARRVFCWGMRESFAMAHYAYTRFHSVRGGVFLLSSGNGDAEAILEPTPEDLCLVFVFPRYTKATLQALDLFRERSVPVLLVTSPPAEALRPFATLLLPCLVEIQGVKNSSVACVGLLDYLCNAVAVKNGKQALRHMEQCESVFSQTDLLEH
jgi:DNA-binding MurR/RpiR family transcriptional regulator